MIMTIMIHVVCDEYANGGEDDIDNNQDNAFV